MLMVFNVLRKWYYCAKENNENVIDLSESKSNTANLEDIHHIRMHDEETIQSHQGI